MVQEVTLTGFDTHKFKAAVEGIAYIHDKFKKEIQPEKGLLDWMPGMYQQSTSIKATNKYFYKGQRSLSSEVVPFDALVDPGGILDSVDKNEYRHTSDNHVGYFVHVSKDADNFTYVWKRLNGIPQIDNIKCRYVRTNPKTFSIGDIVEARLSFMAISTFSSRKVGSMKFVIILRSLASVDTVFTQVCS
jgi:hypothetical protein